MLAALCADLEGVPSFLAAEVAAGGGKGAGEGLVGQGHNRTIMASYTALSMPWQQEGLYYLTRPVSGLLHLSSFR